LRNGQRHAGLFPFAGDDWKAGKRQIITIDRDLVTITEKGLFTERNAG